MAIPVEGGFIGVCIPRQLMDDFEKWAHGHSYCIVGCTAPTSIVVDGNAIPDTPVAILMASALVELHDIFHPDCGKDDEGVVDG